MICLCKCILAILVSARGTFTIIACKCNIIAESNIDCFIKKILKLEYNVMSLFINFQHFCLSTHVCCCYLCWTQDLWDTWYIGYVHASLAGLFFSAYLPWYAADESWHRNSVICFYRGHLIRNMASNSDYEAIVRHCVKNETLWEDPEFPAVQSSVFYHQTPPFTFQWKRPHVSKCKFANFKP